MPSHGIRSRLALAGSGDDDLEGTAQELTDVVRGAAADLAYAYVDLGAHRGAPGAHLLGIEWTASAGNAGYHITRSESPLA